MAKRYPDSPWYRTGEIRVVPAFMGFMQAQEMWRKDSYNQYNGTMTGFCTEWRSVGKLPTEIDDNFYAYLEAYPEEDEYRRKWRRLIYYFGYSGIKDPTPQSPEENARWHRNYQREKDKEQAEIDKRPSDED